MVFAHTTIHVTNLDRSIVFYERLGMPLCRRFGPPEHEIAFMGDGETKLELISNGSFVDHDGIPSG